MVIKMPEIRYALESDRSFWRKLDSHLPDEEFDRKVRDRQAYILTDGGEPRGLLRYNLFWDTIPFCNLLFIESGFRGRGFGRALMEHWEADMRSLGFGMLLLSTQSDEDAQHFYRKLGYRDCGALLLTLPGFEQPTELFFCKGL